MNKRRIITASLSLAAAAAFGGSLSSLSVEGYFDNNAAPAVRVARADETVQVPIAGDWFASGACVLYCDGELVAQSDGPLVNYALAGADDTYVSYTLELRSAEGTQTKVVTFFPSSDYKCLMHALAQNGRRLDARPAGTVRRVMRKETTDITWSGFWNDAADRSVVTLFRGSGTAGECLGELVNETERGEGAYALCPKALSLDMGRYTLTHFDGVETLNAEINVGGGGPDPSDKDRVARMWGKLVSRRMS